jgi:hypothetical protein
MLAWGLGEGKHQRVPRLSVKYAALMSRPWLPARGSNVPWTARASRRPRLILSIRLPGQAARAIRAGANLAPNRAGGRRTWEDFLSGRLR